MGKKAFKTPVVQMPGSNKSTLRSVNVKNTLFFRHRDHREGTEVTEKLTKVELNLLNSALSAVKNQQWSGSVLSVILRALCD